MKYGLFITDWTMFLNSYSIERSITKITLASPTIMSPGLTDTPSQDIVKFISPGPWRLFKNMISLISNK